MNIYYISNRFKSISKAFKFHRQVSIASKTNFLNDPFNISFAISTTSFTVFSAFIVLSLTSTVF